MNPSPDKLFRDQLEPLRTAPPPGVWDRISVDLKYQRRRKSILRWSALCLMILIFVAGGLLLSRKSPETSSPGQQESKSTHLPMAAKTPPTPVEADENQSANTSPAARAPRKTSVPVVKESKLVPSNNIAEANDASIEMQGEPSLAEFIIETDNTLPAIEQGDHASAEQEAVHPRAVSAKIVYSVSDVSRFKRKPKPAPVDTARSALQRVIDVAYEIKNENTWLGDLRQMKDELLSRPGNGPSRDK